MQQNCYSWRGVDSSGICRYGTIISSSKVSVIHNLQQQHIAVVRIRRQLFWLKNTPKLKLKQLTSFTRQLSTLISAHIPLLTCMDILSASTNNRAVSATINTLISELNSGISLTKAMRNLPNCFNNLYCSLVSAGEQSGNLDLIFNYLADNLEKRAAIRRKIIKALLYPAVILTVAITITVILLMFVIPQFAQLYQSAGAALPPFTQQLLAISHTLQNHALLLLICSICTTLSLALLKQYSTRFNRLLDIAGLQLPLYATLLHKSIIARIAHTLAIAYKAGLPLTSSLQIAATITNNHVYTSAILSVYAAVNQGKSLHMALKAQALLPQHAVAMVQIGEESGTLDIMLNKLADYYSADIDQIASHLNNLLEPTIMVILGLLIGSVVVGMYLPIFKLGMVL